MHLAGIRNEVGVGQLRAFGWRYAGFDIVALGSHVESAGLYRLERQRTLEWVASTVFASRIYDTFVFLN